MNIVMKSLLIAAVAAPPVFAQAAAALKLAHLDKLSAKASEVVDVNLEGSTLNMALQFLDDDPELKDAIKELKGIYVKVYEFEQPGAYTPEDVAAVRSQLEGWSKIVNVRSKKDGDVEVYVLPDGNGGNLGLTVIVAEQKQLVVANIVGAIDLQKLRAVEGQLGIPKVSNVIKE